MAQQEITTKEMAAFCDVTPGAVSNWFSTGRISKESLLLVSQRLEVSVSDLISGEETPHPYPPKVDHPHTERATDHPYNFHKIQGLEEACNTLARCFEDMPEEDRDNAVRWLSGLVHRPSSAPHVIGALTEMVVTPRKSPAEKPTGTTRQSA